MFKKLKSYIQQRQEVRRRQQRNLARTQSSQSDVSPKAQDDLVISIRPVSKGGEVGEWKKVEDADGEE